MYQMKIAEFECLPEILAGDMIIGITDTIRIATVINMDIITIRIIILILFIRAFVMLIQKIQHHVLLTLPHTRRQLRLIKILRPAQLQRQLLEVTTNLTTEAKPEE